MNSSSKPSDIVDVTLASEDATTLCKHFQTGYCKFGAHCRKVHVIENCKTVDCDRKTCRKRHPKSCKFFTLHQSCKFGNMCCYKHITGETKSDLLSKQVNSLQATVDKLQSVVKDLEAKIMRFQSLTRPDSLLSSPEKERCTEAHDSLEVSLVLQDREELSVYSVPSSPLSPLKKNPTICEWCYCSFKTSSNSEMKKHVEVEHAITSDFFYPNSNVKIVCPEGEFCGKEFFLDHTFAMHVYNVHKTGFNCDHCHLFVPGGQESEAIHMKLCTFPCSGSAKCSCKY